MTEHALPALFVLLLWWFSTGAILLMDGLPRRTFRWSMLGASAVAGAAIYGLAAGSAAPTVAGAYAAFTCSLLVWGWHEVSFLLGYITGPRKEPCPEGCAGWRHFRHAAGTVMHHELAIAATAFALVALTWGEPNQVGTWTFMVLWWMRLSAKLNVYLGVPNLTEEFLPDHLDYLKSFFNRKPMNLLFPVSVTAATVVAALLVQAAFAPGTGDFEAVGLTLLATLLALAILEHWFLVLPVPDAALWSWGLRSRESEHQRAGDSGPPPHRAPMTASPQPAVVRPAPAAIATKRAG
ncbi:MAG: putative photosynthetic complex assembly protein PuhE [Pseudomonadota bacterium]